MDFFLGGWATVLILWEIQKCFQIPPLHHSYKGTNFHQVLSGDCHWHKYVLIDLIGNVLFEKLSDGMLQIYFVTFRGGLSGDKFDTRLIFQLAPHTCLWSMIKTAAYSQQTVSQ